ncbi:MAG TPA: hypothetical protein PK294_03235 [Ignavibacteria bacterium]|nr:hypothetical protein [Ignavibacteria bacterium]HQY51019.1 hypothetical protein [Ignavibacteria bacterium]HRA99431.1 hypothetical protein [Ignavibacteria bacterium]
MTNEIRESLLKSEKNYIKLKKTNSRFIMISLIASVLATLLAGLTAFTGPVAGQGAVAWKWTCGIVAVFTATATIFTGMHKQLSVSDHLTKSLECTGKLRSLSFTIQQEGYNKEEAVKEYKRILELYSEYLV